MATTAEILNALNAVKSIINFDIIPNFENIDIPLSDQTIILNYLLNLPSISASKSLIDTKFASVQTYLDYINTLPSIKGDQGLQGIQGLQGDQGLQGIQGAQGDQGIQGIQGAQGDQGIQGVAGLDGVGSSSGLLTEYTVLNSAVSSVTFDGLDLNLHKSYKISVDLVMPSNSYLARIDLFSNTDVAGASYRCNHWSSYSSVYETKALNTPTIFFNQAGIANVMASLNGNISFSPDGRVMYSGLYCNSHGTDFSCTGTSSFYKSLTLANLTKLSFISSIANNIGIGSKFKIYRGDV